MKKFTARIISKRKGIRTYYKPQIRRWFLGIPFWVGIVVYRHNGTYSFDNNWSNSKYSALREIEDLKHIYGEDSVTIIDE